LNYFPFHIGDYAVHTRHLSLMEDLAYRRCLDLYYTREHALPADVAQVARLIGMREHQAEVEAVLKEFFVPEEHGDWVHSRCEAEIKKAQEAAERARNNGKAGGRPAGSHKQPSSNPQITQPVSSGAPEESKSKAPITQDQYQDQIEEKGARKRSPSFQAGEIELPSWLERELWEGWCKERRARGKPITERAAKEQLKALDEYRRNGHPPERVISHAIASGNQGLFPPPLIRGAAGPPTETRLVETWKPEPPQTPEQAAAAAVARQAFLDKFKKQGQQV
jgi:uncharacterized protein YdaU (DUF1376 family)